MDVVSFEFWNSIQYKAGWKSILFADNDYSTTPPCVDKYSECTYWAEQGKCSGENESYMAKNCRISCKLCEEPSTTTWPTSKMTTTPEPCNIDKLERCPEYAEKGSCKSSYIKKNCRKSCNQCCFDKEEMCKKLAEKGYCDPKFESWMLPTCNKSCNKC